MTESIRNLTTRASLSATAVHNARWFAGIVVGAAALSAPAANAETWNGSASANWNEAANWTPATVPNAQNAVINTVTPRYPIVTNNPLHDLNDIIIGVGAGTTGRLDQSAGLIRSNAWVYVGTEGGNGTLNVTGSSNFSINERLWLGGSHIGNGGTGVATINTSGTLTAGSDIGIGSSGGTGTLNLAAGTIQTGGWTFIGKRESADNGNGTVNITGGTWNNTGSRTFVGLGNSTGKLNISGGSYNHTLGGNADVYFAVGVNNNAATLTPEVNLDGGNLNVNRLLSVGGTSAEGGSNPEAGFQGPGKGKLTITSPNSVLGVTGELWVGQGPGSNGQMTVDAGLVNAGSWLAIARRGGSTGTLTMNGGTITKTGDGHFIVGDGGTGTLDFPAGKTGAVTVNNDMWVGQAAGGNGTVKLHSGSISVGGWVPIGREGGVATVDMSGGTWNQNGAGQAFIVGSSGKGTMNMTGGAVNVARLTWVSEGGGANDSQLTLSGTAVFTTPIMSVGPEANGTLNLNLGGTLATGRITGLRASDTGGGFNASGGTGTINFNGGLIKATASQELFIADVDVLNVGVDGLRIDSNGFDVGVPVAIPGSGGIFKSGEGTLTFSGGTPFGGMGSVAGGTLAIATATNALRDYSIANAAGLRVNQLTNTGILTMSNLTLGASTLTVSAAAGTGNPASAPFRANNNVAVLGQVTLSLVDPQPAPGLFPVLSYGTKSGTGSFVAGTVPSGVQLDPGTPVVESGNVVSLNILRAVAPRWVGASNGGIWDTTTPNWINAFNGATVPFANGDPATFDDLLDDPSTYNVVLNSTVTPGGAGVIFHNDLDDFSLTTTGAGKITGSAGLTKRGVLGLNLGNLANEFTGPVRIEQGSITVNQLANAANASPLGKGTLILAGGSLIYGGPAVTIDRGFQINAPAPDVTSELVLANNVTMSGQVTATRGKFRLSGAGILTLSHAGPISLANGPQDVEPASFVIDGKGLTLSGTGQVATVNGNTQLAVAGGADTTLTLSGNTVLNVNRFQAGFGTGSTTNIVVQNTARIQKSATGWFSVGNSNDAIATMTVRDNGRVITEGGDFNIGDTAQSDGRLVLQNNAVVTSVGSAYIGKNSAKGSVTLSGASSMTAGNTDVAGGDNSTGSLSLTDTSIFTSTGRMLVGPGGTAAGSVTVDGSATVQVNSYVSVGFTGGGTATVKGDGTFNTNDDFSVNEASPIPAVVTVQDTGALSMGGTLFIGRNGERVGTLDLKGAATLDQTGSGAQNFFVGLAGIGTLKISGTAVATASSANGVVIGQDASGVGTVNLDGGTLVTKRVFGNNGTSTVHFNGGLLRAGAGANPDFIAGVDTALVDAGGANIDSNGQNVAVNVPLLAGTPSGGLTKSGTGTLRLNGVNTYTGATTVTAGNLGGTGTIAGSLTVQAGAGIAPGATTGTLTASGAVTLSSGSNFVVTLNDSQTETSSRLSTPGTLSVAGVNLQVNLGGAASQPSYTIATAGTVTGTFASVPAGVVVTYNPTSITITPPPATPFQSWIGNFEVGSLDQPGDDADGDGLTNLEEFALDGDPASGAPSGKVRSRIETVGGQQALVITLPVRVGATFDNNPGPGLDATVVADDLIYLIRGSNNLSAFDQGVTEVTPASTVDMPGLSDGTKWTYRTFRLDGAIPARGARGFLDVQIQEVP